ncbi:MAG: HlyD family efflux transporter periplasmic adaptor subunit [Sphingomonas sp.]|uniref:HlyD family secretion protein n=1 Tax=Sphingomonas sp. TaxID=28214 RepID=UPI001802DD77|nr:HlyD family efflux transporter periplasmic adaptor subunit [Sphingomonas sp.]MBA3666623.1 HlyD family efflux transporter periplasmic adaptor subunit [Sphingomonas sp.]
MSEAAKEPTRPPEARSSAPVKRRPPRAVLAIVGVAIVALIAGLLLRPDGKAEEAFTGYVVTDNLYLSSPVAGSVQQLWVARGQRVAAGAPLFRIDPTSLSARADQARAQIDEAQAGVATDRANLAKSRAALGENAAEVERTSADLARYLAAQRSKPGAVAQQQIDQARAAAVAAQRQRDAAQGELAAAAARISSAEAQVGSKRAGLTDAERQVQDLSPLAPAGGRIEDVLFQRGEWAAANAPIISLIPDDQIRVRFYVPQALIAAYRPGTRVAIACDGCSSGMTATVNYVASRPEYTPPVIYSLKTRDKLVFLVEAAPSAPHKLIPGQPIDVSPQAR